MPAEWARSAVFAFLFAGLIVCKYNFELVINSLQVHSGSLELIVDRVVSRSIKLTFLSVSGTTIKDYKVVLTMSRSREDEQ